MQVVVPNDLEDDPDAVIFQISDIAHLVKKFVNHTWKSDVRRTPPDRMCVAIGRHHVALLVSASSLRVPG